jgi:predicted amidohydrolase
VVFALKLRKKHRKTSVMVAGECQLAKRIQNKAYMSIRIHKHKTTYHMIEVPSILGTAG